MLNMSRNFNKSGQRKKSRRALPEKNDLEKGIGKNDSIFQKLYGCKNTKKN